MIDLRTAKRIVVKVGSALVVDPETAAPREAWLASVAADLAALREGGAEVVLVSSGAIALARRVLGLTQPRLRLEEKQAAAAVGQIRLAGAWQGAFAAHGIAAAQLLLTLEDSEDRRRYLNARAGGCRVEVARGISCRLESEAHPRVNGGLRPRQEQRQQPVVGVRLDARVQLQVSCGCVSHSAP